MMPVAASTGAARLTSWISRTWTVKTIWTRRNNGALWSSSGCYVVSCGSLHFLIEGEKTEVVLPTTVTRSTAIRTTTVVVTRYPVGARRYHEPKRVRAMRHIVPRKPNGELVVGVECERVCPAAVSHGTARRTTGIALTRVVFTTQALLHVVPGGVIGISDLVPFQRSIDNLGGHPTNK